MLDLILKAFYLVLPAYLANMAPPIFGRFGWLKSLNRPVDGGIKLGRDYLFGQTKTWRGIMAAVIFGLLTTGIQAWLYDFDFFRNLSLINYGQDFIWFGILAGLGAILGDLVKSFFKRRLHLKSGDAWPIFDQLDFIAGFFLFTWYFVRPDWQIILTVCLMTLILHPLVNIIGYFLRFKKVWW